MGAQLWLPTPLRLAGLPVIEVHGWQTRGHDMHLDPHGGLWHHTAGRRDLDIVVHGRADLPGPLANLYLSTRGVWHVVAAGTAWHAGMTNGRAVTEAVNGSSHAADHPVPDDYTTANHDLIGVECEGGTPGYRWPRRQIRSLIVGTAAICAYGGWTERNWRQHREVTARKVDMSYHGHLRHAVAVQLERWGFPHG